MLFHGCLTFFMPPLTRGRLLAHLRMLALPPGLLGPCLLYPLLLPLASSPRGSVGDLHSLWQVVHCSPPPPARRGPERRSWCVPPTVNISGCFRLFTQASGGAHAPRPDGGVRLGGASTARPTRSAGRCPRGRHLALPLPVAARASPSLSPFGGPGL